MMCAAPSSVGQQQSSVVPTLVNFSGTLADANGKALTGTVAVSFYLYQDEQGGSALWMETQNVTADKSGHYAVTLGATKSEGLPTTLFASGQARWLGVQAQGQAEQPRVLLLSVPYALKAGDAQTVGGLSPSAFVLAPPTNSGSENTSSSNSNFPPLSGTGTTDYLPIWTNSTTLGSSVLFQSGTGTTAKVGIGTTKPASTLDVKGGSTIRGLFSLPATGTATASKGFNSQAMDLAASVFNSGTSTAVTQTFQWDAEAVGNDTKNASGSLNLLFAQGTGKPAETGFNIASNGQITFAKGQTFPGTGDGTVTSVGLGAPSSDFTVSGSPVTTHGALGLAWNVAPTSANTANAIVKRDASGNFSVGTISAGSLTATEVTGNNGSGIGVQGFTNSTASNAYGVFGYALPSSGTPIGVYGLVDSAASPAVFGQNQSESSTGSSLASDFAIGGSGVWGDGGTTTGNVGVIGTVDDGLAAVFANNSPTGYYTVLINSENGGFPFVAASGVGGPYCNIDNAGDINCTGAKNAVVPIDAGKRTVALAAIESPKNWFEDFGSAELVNGVAVITLDPDFIQTVNTEMDYKVFPVPNGDCKGLYVTHKTATSFEVRELGGGTSNVSFDYRITALRRKYENVRFADHTHDLDSLKRMQERARTAGRDARGSHMPTNKTVLTHPAMQTTAAK